MNTLLTFTWDMSKGLDLGFFTLRYYSLLFALGFILGYLLMKRIFQKEGIPLAKLDTLLTYVVIATIVGARLGHVFFYQWDYYSQHIDEIFKVWEGGLASHGAAIAIIIAIYIYCKRELKKPMLWMLDRVVITVALAGCLIRLGNWFNSEIYGEMANSKLETVFTEPVRDRILGRYGDAIDAVNFEETGGEFITDSLIYPIYNMSFTFNPRVDHGNAEQMVQGSVKSYLSGFSKEDKNILITGTSISWDSQNPKMGTVEAIGVPRHPTQLYEAFGYLMIFFILYRIFMVRNLADRQGFIFGMFLILVFGFRFFIEYAKENQVSAEEGNVLNIGQMLSIPLVLGGLIFVLISKKSQNEQRGA